MITMMASKLPCVLKCVILYSHSARKSSKLVTHIKRSYYSSSRYFSSKNDDEENKSKATSERTSGEKIVEKTDVEMSSSTEEMNNKDQEIAAKDVDSEVNEKKAAAKLKILSLLSDLTVENLSDNSSGVFNSKLARPLQRMNKPKRTKDPAADEDKRDGQNINEKIMSAVKDVASTVGDAAKEMESELKIGLAFTMDLKEEMPEEIEKQEAALVEDEREIGENMMSAVKAVASTINGDPNEVQSELTKKLLNLKNEMGSKTGEKISLVSMFEGMKIENTENIGPSKKNSLQDDKISNLAQRPRPDRSRAHFKNRVNMSDASPLLIFSLDNAHQSDTLKSTKLWNKLEEKNIKSLVHFAPTNAFEEMIQWTEQGKHWKFPIDNEIDMGEEENVGFHEHVFLDRHLEGFPKKGPVRHFMELVIAGLSKNPYITVERKKENIEWFRKYFHDKEDILKECGALG